MHVHSEEVKHERSVNGTLTTRSTITRALAPPETSESSMSEDRITQVLENGDWDGLWALLPSLPLFRAAQLLAVLRDAGWTAATPEVQRFFNLTAQAAERLRRAYRHRRGLCTVSRRLKCESQVFSLFVTPDNKYLVAGCGNIPRQDGPMGLVLVFELSTGNVVGKHPLGRIPHAWQTRISRDGHFFTTQTAFSQRVILRVPECEEVK